MSFLIMIIIFLTAILAGFLILVYTLSYYSKFLSSYNRINDVIREGRKIIDTMQIHENKINILLSKLEALYDKVVERKIEESRITLRFIDSTIEQERLKLESAAKGPKLEVVEEYIDTVESQEELEQQNGSSEVIETGQGFS